MRFISRNPDRKAASRSGSRAQIVVIFAGAIIVFVGLCAIVIDVSWYWSNTLRMQRAADAAALAGVVFLPGNVPLAVSTARAEAVKNGYTDGVGGIAVTPVPDPTNSRRLKVTISGPVSTYFARAIGITSWNASRQAKADFILPVPMGSPQNYYGVGTLKGTTLVSTVTDHIASKNSGMDVPTTSPAGTPWTASAGTLVSAVASSDTNNDRTTTNGATQQFGGFGLNSGPFAAGEAITGNMTGLQVELTNVSVSAICATTRITVALSWNGGTNWTTVTAQTALLTTTASSITFGSATSTAFWTGHTSWSASDVSDANFRVRLTGVKGCATAGTQLRIDRLRVQANYDTNTPTTAYTTPADPTARTINAPYAGGPLSTQGFWGAVISKGGQRGNGDRYGPANDTPGPGGLNAEYDVNGYDYTVEVGASGRVSIYDPTYCATGTSAGGGSYGAGDHWIGAAGTPFTTVFTLYGTNGTPFDITDDISVATSGSMFASEVQADYGGSYGQPAGWTGPNTGTYTNCASNPYHNAWWNMKTGLAAGTYRLNVQASDAGNNSTSAENMWSVWVDGGSAPRIYGGGRMVAYNNLDAGVQQFYMAQIDAVHAGKTMVIELFDPGDVSGGASLKILSPDGNAYNYATFSYTSDNGQPAGSGTQIVTNSGGTSFYNNSVITILVSLPSTYGSTGLTPPGETLPGWWKIEYTVGGGNDTTTWQVSIRGNPVHLVLP